MKTLSHREASALQVILSWGEGLLARAAASLRSKDHADRIAAIVAESNNPSGA
jgi:hypothetical protein